MVKPRRDIFVNLAKILANNGDKQTDINGNFTGYESSEVFLAADKTDKVIPLGVLFKAFELNFVILPKGTMAMVDDDTNETFVLNDDTLTETLYEFLEWRLKALEKHSF